MATMSDRLAPNPAAAVVRMPLSTSTDAKQPGWISTAELSYVSSEIVMRDLPVDQVLTLLAVVDEGTFDAAAAALHLTPSAVSQRIKALEQRTGRVLVTRTKPVRPTASGRIGARFARRLAALQRDTRRELGIADEAAPAHLSIAVNADSLATWFLPALTRLPQAPPIFVDLH